MTAGDSPGNPLFRLFRGSVAMAAVWFMACGGARMPETGAVVEHLESGYACAQAGIEVDDTIVAWRRGDLEGPVESPFDLAQVEQREAPVGPVELTVLRRGQEIRTVLQTGLWKVRSRPVLTPHLLSRFRQVEDSLSQGLSDATMVELDDIVCSLAESGDDEASAWVDLQGAVALFRDNRPEEAGNRLERAEQAMPDDLGRAMLWERTAYHLVEAGRIPPAIEAYQKALGIHQSLGTEGPLVAHLLLQECRADLRACHSDLQTALTIYRDAGAQSMEVAEVLKCIGITAYFRSDWDAAQRDYRQGLAIVRRLTPDSPSVCDFLSNLGLVALKKGDFEAARRVFRESFSEGERLGWPPKQMGYAANYLGLVAKKLGQFEEARMSYQRALEAFRQCRPGGVEEAGILTNLGNVALREGDYRSARIFHQQALELRELINPGGADVAASLNNLGSVLRLLNLYDDARRSLEKALSIKRRLAPESGLVANTLTELGAVARAQERFEDADELLREALEIRTRVTPGHPHVALGLFWLGAVRADTGRTAEAEELWRRAIAINESNRSGMSLSIEEQMQFGADFFAFYRALALLLVDQGRPIEAFDLVERARTGALFAMLTDRSLVPPGVSPELWFEKTRMDGRIKRIEDQRARISLRENPDRLDLLNEKLDVLKDQSAVLLERIEGASPRFKSLSRRQSLSFREIMTVLDPGTVLLSYTVGEDRSLLLTVAADTAGQASLRASVLPLGGEEFALKIDIFRALISRGRSGATMEPALKTQAERLFHVLIDPVRDTVEPAERIVILADGPLLNLPFAALIDSKNQVFFGQWKALVFNPSAGVVAGLKGLPTAPPALRPTLVAFADPLSAPGNELKNRYGLAQLPGSRTEVEDIARIFGDDATVILGPDATEAAVRAASPGATFIHLAVHALADPRAPMESALFLSSGGGKEDSGNDGVLKASEIMNEMTLDADVVTLSACDTAGGREVPGEGIVGLARAFQFAGARSVVVTQWPISDQSTASLMRGFYVRLKEGKGPAVALRDAQRDELALGGASAHPFNWAAFQVMGDW